MWKKSSKYYFFIYICIFSLFKFSYSQSECKPYPTIENGILIKNCKPYKAIGVNYYDAFLQVLRNPNKKLYKKHFKILGKKGIPFIRVNIGGYYPEDWNIYLKNKKLYFSLLDEFIQTAEKNNIGLVITLFWHIYTIPNILNEPPSSIGNPNSKTTKFIKNFTSQIVNRYKNSSAIWVWEFGNEYNLFSDIPDKRKTRKFKIKKLKIKWCDIVASYLIFYDTVRKIDKKRLISTGNSLLRPNSYHLAFYEKWKIDSLQQFKFMFKIFNPDIYNLISIHLYLNYLKKYKYFGIYSFEELLTFIKKIAISRKQILFIGEFGVCRKNSIDLKTERKIFIEMLNTIKENDIKLSALWVYNRSKNDPCNVTFENDRNYQLEYILKLNQEFQNKNSYH